MKKKNKKNQLDVAATSLKPSSKKKNKHCSDSKNILKDCVFRQAYGE